jgi:hypothetical protein
VKREEYFAMEDFVVEQTVEKFIVEQNVIRYSEHLKVENDPATRRALYKLLVEEENKFAVTPERLDKADRYISQCKAHIVRYYDLIDKQKTGGHDARLAERALRNLMELHDIYVSYRRVVNDGLSRRTP